MYTYQNKSEYKNQTWTITVEAINKEEAKKTKGNSHKQGPVELVYV